MNQRRTYAAPTIERIEMNHQQAETKLEEALRKGKQEQLNRVGVVCRAALEVLLDSEHDRLLVMLSLLARAALNAKGSLPDLQGLVRDAYMAQKAAAEAKP